MKIVFRVDASIKIGSGHVMRCLSIADVLRSQKHCIHFVCLDLPGNFIPFIKSCGYSVTTLPPITSETAKEEYARWLTRSEKVDAQQFLLNCDRADIVIIDHYGINVTWENIVRNTLKCSIVAIDDLVRPHQADLIIDQTLARKCSEYKSSDLVLTGQEYAILNSSFCFHHERALDHKTPHDKIRILVSFGAIDENNFTLKALKQLCKLDAQITVLLSSRAPHYEAIKDFASQYEHLTHIDFSQRMAELMLEHDIAIGAPGTTSWERACIGLPSIITPIANNQLTMCEKLSQQGIALLVEPDNIESLNIMVETLTQQWPVIRQKSLSICDGLGAFRVAMAIDQLSEPAYKISLRRATSEDAKLVFNWQQHPDTRRYALNSNTPTWEEHLTWFMNKLNSSYDYFYVIERDGKAVGVVRLDRQKTFHYLVSIYVNPKQYGQGVAKSALLALDMIHPHIHIHATVLAENIASQALFKRAKYKQVSTTSFIRPPILEEVL